MDKSTIKWYVAVSSIITTLLLLCIIITYIIDPFLQYRITDNKYILNCNYTAPGLVKNYDYDTIIIGSSMTQNFSMDLFREQLHCIPLHIGIGGMTDEDLLEYILLANKINRAKKYYICIDISEFAHVKEANTIKYLMEDDILDKLKYSISYEGLIKCVPIDIALSLASIVGYSLPDSYKYRMSIDKFGYWGHQYSYGEEIVLEGYATGAYKVSDIELDNLSNTMKTQIDLFFETITPNENYIFFFPPYSSLYWSDAASHGYLDTYLEYEEYFIKRAEQTGAKIFFFQDDELTTDLDNYRDTTHYSPAINDWMIYCFANNTHIVTSQTIKEAQNNLIKNTEKSIIK